MKFLFMK